MHSSLRETVETEVQTHVEDYGDLIVQNIGARHRTPARNLPDTLPIDGTLAEYDVMGEVDRYGADEAVLLAQKLRGLTVALQGTFTAEANIDFDYVFGFDAEQLAGRFNEDRNDTFGAASDTVVFNEVDNDILYHVSGKASAGHRDTASGTGAAPESFFVSGQTNYLTEVGVLPEISARENLEEYLFVDNTASEAPDDGQFRVYSNWQLYWLETDDEIEGRRIDITD
jgi:hypothetical protein